MKNKKKIFEQTIIDMYGDKGREWLESLPSIVALLADRWEITEIQPVPNLSYNYVVSGIKKGRPVILKIGNLGGFELSAVAREAAALTTLAGPCVKVLAQDESLGALLLERLIPGTMLKEFFPERETENITITSNIIKSFKHCQNQSPLFLPVSDILKIIDKDWPPIEHHLQRARCIRFSLFILK